MKKIDDEKIKLLSDYVGCLDDSCRTALTYIENDEELDQLIAIVYSACTAVHFYLKSKNKD